jgi:tRNA (guanine-N7-)-methyltransferase
MNTGTDSQNPEQRHRQVRSFVRREGRLTPSQQKALETLWPRYGITPAQAADLPAVFGSTAPVTLEIGFGDGTALAAMAAAAPDQNFLGIEVHRPGVGRLLRTLDKQGIDNVRVCREDAVEVLGGQIADASLARILLFFPDPWPKKKHHKRRILQPGFVALAARKLTPGGLFHMATDWAPYAEQMRETMEASDDFVNVAGPGRYAPRPAYRPLTKFEQRGRRLGHAVFDLIYKSTGAGEAK